jgi:hypothetical protein
MLAYFPLYTRKWNIILCYASVCVGEGVGGECECECVSVPSQVYCTRLRTVVKRDSAGCKIDVRKSQLSQISKFSWKKKTQQIHNFPGRNNTITIQSRNRHFDLFPIQRTSAIPLLAPEVHAVSGLPYTRRMYAACVYRQLAIRKSIAWREIFFP